MINLLPIEEKKRIRAMYRARAVVVLIIFATLAGIASVVFLLPSYTAVSSKYESAELSSQIVEGNTALGNDLEKEVEGANRAAKALSARALAPSPREIFREILLERQAGIKINELSYQRAASTEKGTAESPEWRVVIGGTAATRENLLAYMNILKSRDMFASADLPISNFVKDRNIDFSINILLSTSTKP